MKELCFKSYRDHLEENGLEFSPEWGRAVCEGGKTCLLDEGHEGDHDFVDDGSIFVTITE